ncbi:MAG: histidine phosphatase family protein [bacterium]
MKITFVRHGKTEAHELNRRQTSEASLGEVGKDQAKKVAKHLKNKLSDKDYAHIVSSPYKRARETAEFISSEVGLEIIENELIHEILPHPDLDGQAFDSEIAQRFLREVEKFGYDINWKFENGGESIRDVINRAKKFKHHLMKNYKGKNLIVVSHGTFLRIFITYILLGDKYEAQTFKKVMESFKLENTSLTEMEYNEEKGLWYVYCINSTPHLV